jgi:hypothetical protein
MRFNLRWFLVSVAVLLVGLSGVLLVRAYTQPNPASNAIAQQTPPPAVAVAEPKPSIPNAATLFDSVLPQLQQQSKTPILLPTYIPASGRRQPAPATATNLTVYAALPKPQPKLGYDLVLGYTPDCTGGNACRLGSVQGIPKPVQSIEEAYSSAKDPALKRPGTQEMMGPVALSKGIQGWFIPSTCGANCSDALVVWDDNGYRYSVGIKVGDKASLVQMANSAIDQGVRGQ